MKSDKDIIFKNISSALDGVEKSPLPDIDFTDIVAERRLGENDPWESFKRNFESVRGYYLDTVSSLVEFIQKLNLKIGFCDPALRKQIGAPLSAYFEIGYEYSRDRVDELAFAITRGSGVVAETGSIILKDRDSVDRLATVAPWLHIAVVEEKAIYRTVQEALLSFDDDPNIVWVTGPSKTGDIEGILIEGVHGPGEQVCYKLKGN